MKIAKIDGYKNPYHKSFNFKNNKNINTKKEVSFKGLDILALENMASIKKQKMSVDEFKKEGEFIDAKAMYKDKPYNGIMIAENKDGIFELEYKKGELKSSTFFSKYELSPEAQLITPQRKRATSKKVYINKPDEKIIEKYNIATNRLQDGLCLSETTIIRPSEIINEKQGLYEPTVRIAQKQEDGNWKTILSEAFIGSGFQVYRFTIDVNNNKIIEKKSLGVKIPNLYSEPYYTIP